MWGRVFSRAPKKVVVRNALTDIDSWAIHQAKLKSEGKFKLAPAKERALSTATVDAELNGKIAHFTGDITELKIDAIVNAANSFLAAGGGICGAIHNAAGGQLADECDKIGHCDTGETVITKGYQLPAKHVLHTVGPTNGSEEALRRCYQTCLDLSVKSGVRSVAFCCIATGIYGYPNRAAALLALRTVRAWLELGDNRSKMDRIIFCTFMDVDVQLYDRFLSVYFPVEATDVALTDDEKAIHGTTSSSAASTSNGGAATETKMVADKEASTSSSSSKVPSLSPAAATSSTTSTQTSAATTPAVAATNTEDNGNTMVTSDSMGNIGERRGSVVGMDTRSESDVHTLAARVMTQSQSHQ